jgi:transposase InsO family protein
VPREVATDRGTEFMGDIFKQVCKILNVNKINSTAYHRQSIGSLENSHKSLGAYLRIQMDNKPESWSTWLPYWCFAYNTSVHTSTQFTPFELVYGKKCNLPSNLTKNIDPVYNYDSYPIEFKYRLQVSQSEARKNLINSKIYSKNRHDMYTNSICYKPNDQV